MVSHPTLAKLCPPDTCSGPHRSQAELIIIIIIIKIQTRRKKKSIINTIQKRCLPGKNFPMTRRTFWPRLSRPWILNTWSFSMRFSWSARESAEQGDELMVKEQSLYYSLLDSGVSTLLVRVALASVSDIKCFLFFFLKYISS